MYLFIIVRALNCHAYFDTIGMSANTHIRHRHPPCQILVSWGESCACQRVEKVFWTDQPIEQQVKTKVNLQVLWCLL